jgi:hypothetical protein
MRVLRIIGVVAVIVFGVYVLLQILGDDPLTVLLPGEVAEATGEGDPIPESPEGPSVLAEPLLVGSADARDDLYCSGLLFAAHRETGDTLSAEASIRRERIIALADSGVEKLLASGAVDATQTGMVADAHAELAVSDFAAGTPRISVAECEVRGTRLLQ